MKKTPKRKKGMFYINEEGRKLFVFFTYKGFDPKIVEPSKSNEY
jgi:hypothetical protein